MARDSFHSIVRAALEKENWVITHDPYFLKNKTFSHPLAVDLAAEFLEAEVRDGNKVLKIAIEVKCFHGPSVISDFHTAIGQLLNYRVSMRQQEPDRMLLLAIPLSVYQMMENEPIYLLSLQEYKIPFFVYHLQSETIVSWNNQ